MGFSPQSIDAMSLWEFHACLDGYNEAHGGGGRKSGIELSDERLAELGIEGFDG